MSPATKAVIIAGATSGMVTRHRVCGVRAPDMSDASSYAASTCWRAGASRIVMIGMVDRVRCTQRMPGMDWMLSSGPSMKGSFISHSFSSP